MRFFLALSYELRKGFWHVLLERSTLKFINEKFFLKQLGHFGMVCDKGEATAF